MDETSESSEAVTAFSKLLKNKVEQLLREKSKRVVITSVDVRKKRAECWKLFGFPKVDGEIYEDMAACHKCFTVYKYSSSKGNAQLNRHVCPYDRLKAKGQTVLNLLGKSELVSSPSQRPIKLCKSDHEFLQIAAINAAALDSSPLCRYEKEGIKIMLRTAARFGAKYGENIDLAQHIVDRTNLTRKYLPMRYEEVRADILTSLNGEAFCTTTDLWKEKYTGKNYMSITVHHIDTNWKNIDSFIWSTNEYNLEDHTAANISKFYLNNVPDAPFRLVVTDNTNTMPAAFRFLDSDDQIGCISHLSSLVAKACVTSDEAAEVKLNVEAAKKLVQHIKRADLQSTLSTTLKQTIPTRFYTYREMIGSIIKSWEELEGILDERNELNYLEDINKILLIQTSRVLKPLHDCGLELEKDKEPTLHRVRYWEAKLQAAFSENEQDMTAIKKMKEVGRKALMTKLSRRICVYHDVASALDPRVGQSEDENIRQKTCDKIEYLHDRITGYAPGETENETGKDTEVEETEHLTSKKKKKNPCDEIAAPEFVFYKKKQHVSSIVDEFNRFTRNYFDLQQYENNEVLDILKFWREHARIYPKLAVVARFILACPASSAPSERSFSQAGWTINVRRTRLSPRNLNALLCVRSYMAGTAWKAFESSDPTGESGEED